MIDCHCHLCDNEFEKDRDEVVLRAKEYDSNPETGPVARSVRERDFVGLEDWFEKHHQSLVAIGETGLDYTPRYINSEEDKPAQQAALKKQIELSKKYDLPLICHSRSSGKPVIAFLLENNAKNVLLHAFDGNAKSATPGIEAGYFFSVPPSISRSTQARNEPMNVRISCEWIAQMKNVDIETVKRVTAENAMRLFPKLKVLLQ